MNIVMVSTGSPPDPFGGIGVYIEGLLGGLESQDVRVHLVGASRHRDLPRRSEYRGAAIRRVFVSSRRGGDALPRTPLGMMAAVVRLNLAGAWHARRLSARERVDVVSVHDWMCAPAGLICAVVWRLPVIYHVHSAEIFLGARRRGLVSAAGRALSRALSRRARLVVVPSSGTTAAIPGLAGRDDVVALSHGAGKAWRMELPDDGERAAVREKVRSSYAIPDGGRLVVFAGRYTPHKGVAELIDAVHRLRDDGTEVTLVVAGTGWPDDTSLDTQLRAHAARLGVSDRVHVLGRLLDTDELRDHLVAADACAFPSRYEPFGFVALEAMALEARIVVGPGFDPTVVGSAEGACLQTATTEPAELARALLRAVGDDDPAMGERARRYVLEHHSWEAAAKRTVDAYTAALTRP